MTAMFQRLLLSAAAVFAIVGSLTLVRAETATVVVSGGGLSVIASNITLPDVTLNGSSQIFLTSDGGHVWTVTDARGTGVGWHLTIDTTDFTDGGSPLRTIDLDAPGADFAIIVNDVNTVVGAGSNTAPVSSVSSQTSIPDAGGAAPTFMSAAVNTGMGSYTFKPVFIFTPRADTYVGTGTYTATITVTAVSGP